GRSRSRMWSPPSRRSGEASRPTATPSYEARPWPPPGGRWRRLSPASWPELVPRVLVADPIAEAGINRLREHADVDVELRQNPAALVERIEKYDALIVRSETRVDANVIMAGTRLKGIGRARARGVHIHAPG